MHRGTLKPNSKAKFVLTLVSLLVLGTVTAHVSAMAQSRSQPVPDPHASSPDPMFLLPPEEPINVDHLLTPAVVAQILRTVAEDVGLEASSLRIASSESATWDGCMGIYQPNQACTMIAISGMRLVVTDGDRSWIYHTNQDGQSVVQNPTASGSRNGLLPDFLPPGNAIEPYAPDEYVFRSTLLGRMDGTRVEVVLLPDGRLLQQEWPMEAEEPIVLSEQRVSLEQVQQFQQLLETQRFPNLHRLRYITDAAFADYPTVRLSTMYSQTEYIDLAQADLPEALQAVIQAWEELSAPAQ